jgi:hypothetical protein
MEILMKHFLRAGSIAFIFLAHTAAAQTTYLTDEELTKEFDRDVVFVTPNKAKISHTKGGGIESNHLDGRGRPDYDSGKFVIRDGKYCTKWIKTRANEEACFLILKRDGDLVFHSLDGKELGTRREVK